MKNLADLTLQYSTSKQFSEHRREESRWQPVWSICLEINNFRDRDQVLQSLNLDLRKVNDKPSVITKKTDKYYLVN